MCRLWKMPGRAIRAILCFLGHHRPRKPPMPRLGGGYETFQCAHCEREWDWQWT
jgi:hypothetical protein